MTPRIVKRLADLTDDERTLLVERGRTTDGAVRDAVQRVVADVRERGDEALRELTLKFDHVDVPEPRIPAERLRAAWRSAPQGFRDALSAAARNVRAFHARQVPKGERVRLPGGAVAGRLVRPVANVGVYVPGGRAAYPSTVVMTCVPAAVAGVRRIAVATPPGPDGSPSSLTLAALHAVGVKEVYAAGGAQAIAALAYGTPRIPPVDLVVGPGNAYVAEAKRQVFGRVAIDTPAGPSEVLVVADRSADARAVALDLIAQAEHDPDAAVCLVTTDARLFARVQDALREEVEATPRRDIVERALGARGALLLARDLREALAFANDFAPEHLILAVRDAARLLPRIESAGSIFLGHLATVPLGDYGTGTNHVLPTGGAAKRFSGLSVDDFLRKPTWQEVSPRAFAALAPVAITLADLEGLHAHADAVRARLAPKGGTR